MSALWAYSGQHDPSIEASMAGALAHRGSHRVDVLRSASTTVGVALAHDDTRLGGIARDVSTGRWLAAVGRLRLGVSVDDLLRMWITGGAAGLRAEHPECIVMTGDGSTTTVIRDAAGVRTAYWTRHGGRVLVAVEPKAIVAVDGVPRRIDARAVAQFLMFSFVPGERCSVEGISELPAGSELRIDDRTGDCDVRRWFVHEDIQSDGGDAGPWVRRARTAIDRAVADRLPPGESVGAFLSGGLDSSLVVAAACASRRERGESPPTTFSLHFGHDLPNELAWSQAVADHCQTEHHVLEVSGADLRPVLRRMVWHLDEPIGDPVTAGNFVLARLASQHTRWVLNGEGGDPVFGGPKNLPMLLAHCYPTMHGPYAREEQYLATWRRAGDEVFSLLHPDYRGQIDRERDLIGVVRPYFTAAQPTAFLNKLMVTNMRLKGAHLILPKVDRMLGSFRLTPLSPLFDPNVIALSLRMPPQAKLRHGTEKWVLKAAYEDMLPASVIQRPKSGMRVPVQVWFQGELKRMARELLSPRSVRQAGVFDPSRVRDVLKYRTGRDGLRSWMLVTFELWRRLVIDRESL